MNEENKYKFKEPKDPYNTDITWYICVAPPRWQGRTSPLENCEIKVGDVTWAKKPDRASSSLLLEGNRHTTNFERTCFKEIPNPYCWRFKTQDEMKADAANFNMSSGLPTGWVSNMSKYIGRKIPISVVLVIIQDLMASDSSEIYLNFDKLNLILPDKSASTWCFRSNNFINTSTSASASAGVLDLVAAFDSIGSGQLNDVMPVDVPTEETTVVRGGMYESSPLTAASLDLSKSSYVSYLTDSKVVNTSTSQSFLVRSEVLPMKNLTV